MSNHRGWSIVVLANFQAVDNKFGRKVIYTAVPEINETNVIDVLNIAIGYHRQNETNITYLENYYTGNQPILYKEKAVRPEINNIVCDNHAYEIVEFMVGQECGEPIQYVSRGTDTTAPAKVQALNDYMAYENKSYWDAELARWKHICGTSYKMCYPDAMADIQNDECPFMIEVPRPHDTFVVYSSGLGKRAMMGVTRILDEDNNPIYYCYTPTMFYKIKDSVVIDRAINGIGMIPIIEYPNNSRRISTIEMVISLLDSINKIQSNRVDDIEQIVQSLMVFENCQIDDEKYQKLREEGAITVTGEPGLPSKVYFIGNNLNHEQTQILLDALYDEILSILGMPSREQNTGGDTGSAVYLRNGWDFAEKRAELSEKPIEKSEREFLRIALNILSTNEIVDLKLSDIDIKFTRSKSDNMVVKSQALLQLLQAGINPQIAIKTVELFPDNEDVFLKSKETMDAKYGIGSIVKPKPTQTGGGADAGD